MANIFSATTSALIAAVAFSSATLGVAVSPALVVDLAPKAAVHVADAQPATPGPSLSASARSQG